MHASEHFGTAKWHSAALPRIPTAQIPNGFVHAVRYVQEQYIPHFHICVGFNYVKRIYCKMNLRSPLQLFAIKVTCMHPYSIEILIKTIAVH